jgi:hypothetical protein
MQRKSLQRKEKKIYRMRSDAPVATTDPWCRCAPGATHPARRRTRSLNQERETDAHQMPSKTAED